MLALVRVFAYTFWSCLSLAPYQPEPRLLPPSADGRNRRPERYDWQISLDLTDVTAEERARWCVQLDTVHSPPGVCMDIAWYWFGLGTTEYAEGIVLPTLRAAVSARARFGVLRNMAISNQAVQGALYRAQQAPWWVQMRYRWVRARAALRAAKRGDTLSPYFDAAESTER